MRKSKHIPSIFPSKHFFWTRWCVIFLAIYASGCGYINRHHGSLCNSRSYVHTILSDYLESRFHSGSPVRMGITPFTVPENLSRAGNFQPRLGDRLAGMVQAKSLEYKIIPIVEIFNRPDWPGKKDEFLAGNYGAIALARDAGYDLLLVGWLDQTDRLDSGTLYGKIIEVEGGITLWYGKIEANSLRDDYNVVSSALLLQDRRPDKFDFELLYDKLTSCMVDEAFREDKK